MKDEKNIKKINRITEDENIKKSKTFKNKNKIKKRISNSAPKDYKEDNLKEIKSEGYTENVTNFNYYHKDLDIITKYIIKSK